MASRSNGRSKMRIATGAIAANHFGLVPGWSADPWGTGVTQVTRWFTGTTCGESSAAPTDPRRTWPNKSWPRHGSCCSARAARTSQSTWPTCPGCSPACRATTCWRRRWSNGWWKLYQRPAFRRLIGERSRLATLRQGVRPLLRVAQDRAKVSSMSIQPEEVDWQELLDKSLAANPQRGRRCCQCVHSAQIVRQLRNRGYQGAAVRWPRRRSKAFRSQAGGAADDGVVYPLLLTATENEFARRFRATLWIHRGLCRHVFLRCGRYADCRRTASGLNRAKIGDAVRNLSPYQGASASPIHWDPLGCNRRSVSLGTINASHDGPSVGH